MPWTSDWLHGDGTARKCRVRTDTALILLWQSEVYGVLAIAPNLDCPLMACYLATEEAGFISGQNTCVNGGFTVT